MSAKKSVIKTVTWRFIATTTTFTLALLFTGSIHISVGIASIEFFAKMALYYVHERFWERKKESQGKGKPIVQVMY